MNNKRKMKKKRLVVGIDDIEVKRIKSLSSNNL
jgi:hypothetical protein